MAPLEPLETSLSSEAPVSADLVSHDNDDEGFRFQDEDFLPPPAATTDESNPYRNFGTAETSRKPAPKRKQKSQIGALLLGSFLSCVGAALGIFIWLVVLFMTEYEIGLIWWGVGALAGFGMQIGVRESDSQTSGIIAAVISFGAFALIKGGLTLLVVAGGGGVGEILTPIDLLFVFLAVSSAYKIGSGDIGDLD